MHIQEFPIRLEMLKLCLKLFDILQPLLIELFALSCVFSQSLDNGLQLTDLDIFGSTIRTLFIQLVNQFIEMTCLFFHEAIVRLEILIFLLSNHSAQLRIKVFNSWGQLQLKIFELQETFRNVLLLIVFSTIIAWVRSLALWRFGNAADSIH